MTVRRFIFMASAIFLFPILVPIASADDPTAGNQDDGKLRIIAFGAHPNDCELNAVGLAAKWTTLGHHVKFVNQWRYRPLADGGGPLSQCRTEEVVKAAKILGIETEVLDIHDGELEPTLENRKKITQLIRQWRADVVFTHHAFGYHPDHRYTSVLVQDSSFMVTVPFFCPDTPHLQRNPVFLYYMYREHDHPLFSGEGITVSIDEVFDKQVAALNAIASQFDEGGALGSEERLARTPEKPDARRRYYEYKWKPRYSRAAEQHSDLLIKWYGEEKG